MFEFGVSFDGRDSATDFQAKVGHAEAAGARTLWVASHLYAREPLGQAAVALTLSRAPTAALMAVSPYVLHPVYAAMAAATLDELHPGRVVLCFGMGAPGDLAAAGIDAKRRVRTLADAIDIARALLAGEKPRIDSDIFPVTERALDMGRRDVPIMLAASGPQMLALAGRVADGVVLSAGTSVPFVESCLEAVERAAAGRRLHRAGLVYGAVDVDVDVARTRHRKTLAVVLRGDHHASNLAMAGGKVDHAALTAAVAAGDWARAEGMISDDIVDNHSASGTAEAVAERLTAYRAAGLDEVVLAGARTVGDLDGMLAVAAKLCSEGAGP